MFKLKGYFLIILLILASCQKKELKPNNDIKKEATVEISIEGKWILIDGQMYIENLDNGDKTMYDHFGLNKSRSSLRYGGSIYEIEEIIKDTTIWWFILPKNGGIYGEFILNLDSLNPYGLKVTETYKSIIENNNGQQQMGGSSRPFYIYKNDNYGNLYIHIQEGYVNIGGIDYKYYNELKFKKI